MNSDGRGWATHRVRSLSVKAMLNLASRFTNDVRRHAGRSDGRAVMLSMLAATGSESGAVISFVMSVRCFHDRGKELELRAGRLVEQGGIELSTSRAIASGDVIGRRWTDRAGHLQEPCRDGWARVGSARLKARSV